MCELEIRALTVEDAGEYSCMCGQEKTSAALAVRGKDRVWARGAVFGVRLLSHGVVLCSVRVPSLSQHRLFPEDWGTSFAFLC